MLSEKKGQPSRNGTRLQFHDIIIVNDSVLFPDNAVVSKGPSESVCFTDLSSPVQTISVLHIWMHFLYTYIHAYI